MAIRGLQILYNLILKDVVKGSGKASGIMSIGGDVRKLADKKFQNYITAAQKQGVDLDRLSEQELKYIIQLNKPKPLKAIPADSPEGQGITRDLFNMLDRRSGKNVIKTDFGKPFAEEVVTVESVVTDIKKMKPMDSMKEANKVLKGEGRYKSLSKADREKIAMDESVTDHIFEREIKPDPEDLAEGGRTGLSYLLAEDSNQRVPLKDGHSPGRRKFLKLAAGLATLPVVGKFFKWAKPAAKVADVTQVPIKNISGMPAWFKPLVNKVIKEGEQAKVTEYDRLITHTAKLPESKTPITVNQDLNTGDVWVDIGRDKHGFADGHYGQPVRLEYKAKEVIEPDVSKTGKVKSKGGEVKEEFWVEEAEWTGGHPENVKFEETSFNKFGEHGSNFDEVEMFATGKVKKSKPTKKAERTEWESGKAEADAERWTEEAMDDDFASGGVAKLLGE